MVEARKHHCWECLQRRLVCDFQVPGCKRCAGSGVDCPGYGETPPIRVKWVAPGKVKSRQRNGQRNGSSNRQKNSRASSGSVSTGISKGGLESSEAESGPSDESQGLAVPRFHLKTDHHALLDSVQYCMSISLRDLPRQSKAHLQNSQLMHVPSTSLSFTTRHEYQYIPTFTESISTRSD